MSELHPEYDYLVGRGKVSLRKQKENLISEQLEKTGGVKKDSLYFEYQKQIDAINQQLLRTDIGDMIWNISRDSSAMEKYIDEFTNKLSKKHFDAMYKANKPMIEKWWEDLTTEEVLGPPAVDGKSPNTKNILLRKILKFGKKITGAPVSRALFDVYSGYQNIMQNQTTSTSEGLLSGGMTGATTGASIGTLLSIAGPWPAIIGALTGGLLGRSQAQKNAEAEANRIRKQMLAKLNDIDNHIKPVSDYFNRGAFGALTQAFSFGGGISAEMGWAIDSRRGVR